MLPRLHLIYRSLSTVKLPIYITDKASKEVKTILNHSNYMYMIFSAKGGGCNGFEYQFLPSNDVGNKDIKINEQVYLDYLSEMLLLGTSIDFEERNYEKGIFHPKFTFIPKKELATTCGCGVSFSPKL